MRMVSISGLIVSKNGCMIFTSDGTSEVLSQDGWRTKNIIMDINMGLMKDEGPVVLDLDAYSMSSAAATINAVDPDVKVVVEGTKVVVEVKAESGEIKKIDMGETMTKHIDEAAYCADSKGFVAFMKFFAEHKCPHGSRELLDFMQKTDLPIADDGMIVAYKILSRSASDPENVYVDPHTRKVTQKLGSLVEINPQILDTNTRELCSTGLHVCYKDYVNSFGGDVLTLIKIAPQDCIAVNKGQHKMRVAKYHICAVLPDKSYAAIKGGASARDQDGSKVLLDVIAGNHPPILESVMVMGRNGEDLRITPVIDAAKARKAQRDKISKELRRAKAGQITPADIKKVNDSLKAAKKTPAKVVPLLPKVKAAATIKQEAATASSVRKEFEKKLVQAFKLLDQKQSIRTVAKTLHMDRETLSRELKARNARQDAIAS